MKYEEYLQLKNSDEWVRIQYFTRSSSGEIIFKKLMYDKIRNKPKFKRLFKDCTFMKISEKYRVTMADIVRSALQEYERRYDLETFRIHNELKRMKYDPRNIAVYTERRQKYINIIKRLERKLK